MKTFRMARGPLLAIVTMAAMMPGIAGCSGDEATGPQEVIDQKAAAWKNAGLHDYDFRYRLGCFCDIRSVAPVIVSVRKDTVAEVVYADTRMPVEQEYRDDYPTIDSLFATLREAARRKAFTIDVQYDPLHGYPVQAWIDYVENMADEEIRFTVDSLRVAP